MNTAIEGRQIPLDTASKVQLRAFAQELGCAVTNFDTEDKLRAKIRDAGHEESYIIVADHSQGAADAPKEKGAAAKPVTEPMVLLTVHMQEGPGGKRAIFVAVNGVGMLIPRNKQVEVKLRYLRVLENAIETKYDFDEDAKANVPRDLPSYPYQVNRMPSQDAIDAWHAFEAKEEAKRAASDRALEREHRKVA